MGNIGHNHITRDFRRDCPGCDAARFLTLNPEYASWCKEVAKNCRFGPGEVFALMEETLIPAGVTHERLAASAPEQWSVVLNHAGAVSATKLLNEVAFTLNVFGLDVPANRELTE